MVSAVLINYLIFFFMKNKLFVLALAALFAMPCFLYAEEQVIQLFEVIEAGTLPGDEPLDGNDHMPDTPPRPTDFRATINGNSLSVIKQNENIPAANVLVVNVSTGNMEVNQSFTSMFSTQIQSSGSHWITIHTYSGSLVGMFITQ